MKIDKKNWEVKLQCPRCKHVWIAEKESLELEQLISKHVVVEPKKKTSSYRASCPVCGTIVAINVEED